MSLFTPDSSIPSLIQNRLGLATPIIETVGVRVEKERGDERLVLQIRSDDGPHSSVIKFLGRKMAQGLAEASHAEGLPFEHLVFSVLKPDEPLAPDAQVVYTRLAVKPLPFVHKHMRSIDELVAFLTERNDSKREIV